MRLASLRRVEIALGALFGLTLLGTTGYMAIEGLPFVEALYMTVITLSTVGYREVGPLSTAGLWYTIGLIGLGIGTAFYTFAALAGFLIEGTLRDLIGRRSMQRAIASLRDHVIICGFGRTGGESVSPPQPRAVSCRNRKC